MLIGLYLLGLALRCFAMYRSLLACPYIVMRCLLLLFASPGSHNGSAIIDSLFKVSVCEIVILSIFASYKHST